MSQVQAFYYTDPMCPWSWAAEPARLSAERAFAGGWSLTYVMSGAAREFGPVLPIVGRWLEAGARSAMPVDPRLWLDAPPRGSFAACIAVIVAGEQGLAAPYLRRAREAVALERRALDHAATLVELARDVPGLDLARFQLGLSSHAVLETFGEERARAQAEADGASRLEVMSDAGPVRVSGDALLDPTAWGSALQSAGAARSDDEPPTIAQALRAHRRLATVEIAATCDLPGPAAPAQLWRLAGDWTVRAERQLGGEMWTLA
jgi:protein-disulfide isomerase-like protein with CxxC motif